MKKILCVFALLLSATAFAEEKESYEFNIEHFTDKQQLLLLRAYTYGLEIGYPETIQAMLLQETLAGHYGHRDSCECVIGFPDKDGGRGYGVMSLRIEAIRFVLQNHPEILAQYFGEVPLHLIADDELVIKATLDNDFNILIGSRNFELMLKYTEDTEHSWSRAVASYNVGWGAAQHYNHPHLFTYTKLIVQRIHEVVRPFNKHMGLKVNQ